MKRLLLAVLLVSLIVFSAGCKKAENQDDMSSPFKVTLPSDNSVNGYRLESDKDSTQSSEPDTNPDTETTYYANVKTKKIHLKECTYAKNTDKDNIYITDNRAELIDMGYSPCKRCNP